MKSYDSDTIQTLSDEIVTLCGHIHAAEYRLIELIRRLDELKPWDGEMPSCAHWLNWRCGIDLVTAREKVRIAHALPRLPKISEAFRDGRLSYSKVRAITRIAAPDTEAELVEVAASTTAAHVEKLVKAQRQAERLQDAHVAFNAYRHRALTCHYDEDGSLVFEGRLPGEVGAMLLLALDRAMEWLYFGQPHRQRAAHDDARIEDIPPGARRADALAILAERFLTWKGAHPPGHDEGLNAADRYQVVVHASAEALPEYGPIDPADPPQVEDGPVLAAETVRRLTCDCALVPMLESGTGEPLDVGRKQRTMPPALNRAVKRRDRGCRFPGCVNSRFVQGHHIEHWADGGPTKLENIVSLCRHHHVLMHEGGYYVVRDGPLFLFCRGDGLMVPRVADVRLTGSVEALAKGGARRVSADTS